MMIELTPANIAKIVGPKGKRIPIGSALPTGKRTYGLTTGDQIVSIPTHTARLRHDLRLMWVSDADVNDLVEEA